VFVKCPLCAGDKYSQIHKERGALGIVKCLDCGLIYVNPRLNNPEQVYWGDADKYYEEARLIFQGKAIHHRDKNYIQDLNLIYRYKPVGNFLDIGTNMGFFLRNAVNRGWNIYGLEPSGALSEMARRYFGLNVKTAFLETAGFEKKFFEVITMTDVFEHITEPDKILGEVHCLLKPEGILFIKVPNGLFNVLKLHMARAAGKLKCYDIFDSYEHVVHYTAKTLKVMLEKNNFKILHIRIGRPIQLPVWHRYVGQFYQYPTPMFLDFKRQFARNVFYWLSLAERVFRIGDIGYFAPNIIVIAKKI
jgi:2-polyprenyl-3-methyl-5-hydroxy-6-metoxy-1,4-benzoquinol methylase